MRQVGMKYVVAVLALGLMLIATYSWFRYPQLEQVSTELSQVRQQVNDRQLAVLAIEEQRQRLSQPVRVVGFIEDLYATARSAGLSSHEVTTLNQRQNVQSLQTRRSQGGTRGQSKLETRQVKVDLRGDFHSIARYLDGVQSISPMANIAHFEMAAEQGSIRMLLWIDLYALEGVEPS